MLLKRLAGLLCILAAIILFSVTANTPQTRAAGNTSPSEDKQNSENGIRDSEGSNHYIVKLEDNTFELTENKVNSACPAENQEKIDSDCIVKPITEAAIKKYSNFVTLEYIEPDYSFHMSSAPNDSFYDSYQTDAFDAMSIENARDITKGSSSVVVAVLDTGIDLNHPDLKGRILSDGYDFVNDDDNPSDDNGHGTMVAGIISAVTDNFEGVAGVTDCSILPIKVLDAKGNSLASNVIEGLKFAADHGADIINLSLGTPNYYNGLQEAINYAYEKGILVIAAAGNTGSAVEYPAACKNVVAVGAITASLDRASYSCHGSQTDLVAVGSNVASTTYSPSTSSSIYGLGVGTSFATPYVSALAALTISIKPDITPDEIESLMETNAKDLGSAGRDKYYGYGCIDFYKTLNSLSENTEMDKADIAAPVITLNGDESVTIAKGSLYNDAGATAVDETDGNITSKIHFTSDVDTSKEGAYHITYIVKNSLGLAAQSVRRTVIVKANS
ncbi:MAG: S8 family serine peptidase [Oscillospiraceae bacterium]